MDKEWIAEMNQAPGGPTMTTGQIAGAVMTAVSTNRRELIQ